MKKLLVTLLTICMMFSSYTPVLSARPAPVPVQSVSISPDVAELTLAAGTSSTLTAIILPLNASNKKVAWTSSDITIGTVTPKGIVTALKAGTTTITVRTLDGNKTDSLLVRVIPTVTLQSAATTTDGTKVILTFNKAMTDPIGKQGEFTVHAGGAIAPVLTAALNTNPALIELTLSAPVLYGQVVTLDYTAGTITSTDGGILSSFTGRAVTNNLLDLSTASAALSVPGNKESGAAFDISITGARDVYGNLLSGNKAVTAANGAASIYSSTPAFTSGNAVITIPADTASLLPAGTYTLTLTIAGVTPKPTVPVTIIVTSPAPTVSDAATLDADHILLTMSSPLTGTLADPDAFSVSGAATNPTVTGAAVSGTSVTLTLSAKIAYGETITLSYTKTGTNNLTNGTEVSNFTGLAVTNTLLDLSTASAALSVPGNKESGAAFAISITGARDVYGNLLSGSKAVTAANGAASIYSGTPAFTSGNAVITIPAGTASLLPAGTYTLTLTIAGVTPKPTVPVTIIVTSPAPTVSGAATLDADHILLTMSSPLTGTLAAPDAFSVSGAATNPTVTGAAVSGTSVTLTLSAKIAYGETITLSYTKTGTNNLTNGTEVANFTGRAVTNTLANLSTASAALSVPGNKESGAAFAISITGAKDVYGNLLSGNKAVTAANGAASIYSGTPAFTSGNAVITIPADTASLLPAGTYTLTLTIAGVTPKPTVPVTIIVTSPAPTVSGAATLDADHILLTMSSPLTGTLADPDAFSVSGAATNPIITGAAVSGTSVTLTLSAKIAYGETITLSYTKTGTNNLTNGTEVANFTGRAVTNTLTNLSAASAALSVPGNKESGAAFAISITGARDVYGNLLSGNNTVTAANGAASIYSGTPAFTSGDAVITIPAATPSLLPAGSYTLTLTIAGVTPKPTVPVTIIVTVPNDPKGRLIFTFDDGYVDNLTYAAPILASKGFEGTVYVCKIAATGTDPDFMRTSQLSRLYTEYGWDISNHTVTHLGSVGTDPETLERLRLEYLDNQNWILDNGWTRGAYHAAYPGGYYSEPLTEILEQVGVKTARTTEYGLQSVPVGDYYTLPVIGSWAVSSIKEYINQAVATNSTLIIVYHKVQPVAGWLTTPTSELQAVVDYASTLVANGDLEVQAMSDWYNSVNNTTPDLSAANAALSTAGSKAAGSAFDISITGAKDANGNLISGSTAVTVKNGTTQIYSGTPAFTSGNATLTIPAGTSSLTIAGNYSLTVTISGVIPKPVVAVAIIAASEISAGNSSAIIDQPLTKGTTRTITVTLKDTYGNLMINTTKNLKISIAVINSNTTTGESYTVDGTSVTGTTVLTRDNTPLNGSGQHSFSVTLPAVIDEGDGITLRITKADGTPIGSAFSYAGSTSSPKGKLIFTFDDGYLDNLTYAAPILAAKGFAGTVYVCKIAATGSDPDFMRTSQINTLYTQYGWDISNHTVTHLGSYETDPETLERLRLEYLDNQNWILDNGWARGAYHAAYPGGYYTEPLIPVLQGIGIKTARTTDYGLETIPVSNFYKLKVLGSWDADQNVETMVAHINYAIETGSTCILLFHKVQPNPGWLVTPTEDLEAVANYARQKVDSGELQVQTISSWYDSVK